MFSNLQSSEEDKSSVNGEKQQPQKILISSQYQPCFPAKIKNVWETM